MYLFAKIILELDFLGKGILFGSNRFFIILSDDTVYNHVPQLVQTINPRLGCFRNIFGDTCEIEKNNIIIYLYIRCRYRCMTDKLSFDHTIITENQRPYSATGGASS